MLKIIMKSLAGQRIRVFLTIFSIAVGVMVFVSISALLQGLETSVYHTFQQFSANRDILLVPGTTAEAAEAVSVSTLEEVTYSERQILVKHTDFDKFELLDSIDVVEGTIPVATHECIVEYFFAQKEGIGLGDTVLTYDVVGIFVHKKGLYAHILTEKAFRGDVITEMKVDPDLYDDVAEKIPEAVPAKTLSHFFSEGTVNLHNRLRQLLTFIVIILVLSLFVSMNTAVLERKWEIGVLRAVGAQKSFILKLFLYEGVIISCIAAVFGIALGIIFSSSLTVFISEIQQVKGIQPVVTGSVLLQAVAAPVLIGIAGSILPAYRASRMDVSECLVM